MVQDLLSGTRPLLYRRSPRNPLGSYWVFAIFVVSLEDEMG